MDFDRGQAEPRISRRQYLIVLFAAPAGNQQPLLVRRDDGGLRVSAPQIRFLTGKPLSLLRDGQTVSFASLITMHAEASTEVLARAIDRFIVSYDLWEEKFSATRMGPPVRSVSRLNAPACETWCLDQLLGIPAGLPENRPFYLRLELRVEDPKEPVGVIGEPGINVTRLIELFSRPPKSQQPHWSASAGPLRLSDMK